MSPEVAKAIGEAAGVWSVPVDLAQAIARTESNGNPWAVRYERTWRYFFEPYKMSQGLAITEDTERSMQSHSWGLFQVMGSVAREHGFRGPLPQLCIASIGAEYGCREIAELLKKYGGNEAKAVSAFNRGNADTTPDGQFKNQSYVNLVRSYLGRDFAR